MDGAQVVSSRWPEIYVTEDGGVPTLTGTRSDTTKYEDVFETDGTNTVDNVIMLESDGTTTISWNDLLSKYTAKDLAQLVSQYLLLKLPDGVSAPARALRASCGSSRRVLPPQAQTTAAK